MQSMSRVFKELIRKNRWLADDDCAAKEIMRQATKQFNATACAYELSDKACSRGASRRRSSSRRRSCSPKRNSCNRQYVAAGPCSGLPQYAAPVWAQPARPVQATVTVKKAK